MKPLLLLSLLLAPLLSAQADVPAASPAPATDAAAASSTAVDPAKEAEIRKMIQKSGVEKTTRLVLNRMLDSFKTQNSTLPPEFWTRIKSEMNTSDLLNQLIPIYAQYYSLEDLKAVNAFYDSPAGQHMIEVQPQITAGAMQVGQAWGRGVAAKVMSEIQAEQAKTAPSAAPATPAANPPSPDK